MNRDGETVLKQRLNIDLLPHVVDDELVGIGVRVRPYGAKARTDVMLLGYGDTLEDALDEIFARAHEGRWEPLVWSARPWATAPAPTQEGVWEG